MIDKRRSKKQPVKACGRTLIITPSIVLTPREIEETEAKCKKSLEGTDIKNVIVIHFPCGYSVI